LDELAFISRYTPYELATSQGAEMNSCPKCGSWRISGPTYDTTAWGDEVLRYHCARCGYSETRPTLDRKRDELAPQPQKRTQG